MNVIYLIIQNLDDRNILRYGLNVWLKKGWNVQVWNLLPINEPGAFKKILKSNSDLVHKFNYVEIGSYNSYRYVSCEHWTD